jgi:hypothetical protein
MLGGGKEFASFAYYFDNFPLTNFQNIEREFVKLINVVSFYDPYHAFYLVLQQTK